MSVQGPENEQAVPLEQAIAFLKLQEKVLQDRKVAAFLKAFYDEEAAQAPKKRGRPTGPRPNQDFIDKVRQHPDLSSRALARLIDPRPHMQETARKRIDRFRSEVAPYSPSRREKQEAAIKALHKKTGLSEGILAFLVDEDGCVLPPAKALLKIQALISDLEAQLGRKT